VMVVGLSCLWFVEGVRKSKKKKEEDGTDIDVCR
jgi:hypothetical protein